MVFEKLIFPKRKRESMHHFFVDKSEIIGDEIKLFGENFHHLQKVLRGKIGEEIIISAGEAVDYHCKIKRYGEDHAVLSVSFLEEAHELRTKVILLQALPKGEKMELIIQKAVELGVSEMIPLESENCIVQLKGDKAEKKRLRWQGISEAAAKQSKRSVIPAVSSVSTWKEAFSLVKNAEIKLIPYENAKGVGFTKEELLRVEELGQKSGGTIALCIGPEGGFSKEEVEEAKKEGFLPISLGKRILRTETAAITTLSLIMMHLEFGENKERK